MNRAETCHKNLSESLRSKNQAGFLQNNLTGDAVKELGQLLKKDQAQIA